MTKFMALDPGGTTGTVVLDIHNMNLELRQIGPNPHHLELWEYINEVSPDYLIYESFEYRNKGRDNLELISREYIGIIRLWAELNPTRLYKQSAAQAKGFVPDTGPRKNQPLIRLGWYSPCQKHSMDAVRHLVYFLVNGTHTNKELRDNVLHVGFKN